MRKLTLKDFLSFYTPCLSCNAKNSLSWIVNYKSPKLVMPSNINLGEFSPILNGKQLEIDLKVTYFNKFSLMIDVVSHSFISSDASQFLSYTLETNCFIQLKCMKCNSHVLTNNLENLLEIIKERKTSSGINEIQIPLEIFKIELGPAEVLCKYLKENKQLKFNEIAIALNRNQRTIWINYRNSNKKYKEKIKIQENTLSVPIKIFSDRKLSISESIVKYLKDKGLNNSQISKILGKSQNNIWTLHSRTLNKLKNKT